MKRTAPARKPAKQPNPVQMRPTERDEKILGFLRDRNRTLNDAGIIRLALDTLAREQGLPAVS